MGVAGDMLRRVGFFHFCGEDKSDPDGSLRASLREVAKAEVVLGSDREGEAEGRSLSGLGFDPDPPMITIHDPSTNGQSNSCS